MSELQKDHPLSAVAEALGMSERWVRRKIKEGAAHQRYGHKIAFTDEQVAQLRESHTQQAVVQESITTGRKKRAA